MDYYEKQLTACSILCYTVIYTTAGIGGSPMVIIKRSGITEPFTLDKIKASLAASSDEAGQPIPESDLKYLAADLLDILEGKESVRSEHIVIIVAGLLYTSGYQGILEQYLAYRKKKL
jgi:transcriptional regulator NrdR family protein